MLLRLFLTACIISTSVSAIDVFSHDKIKDAMAAIEEMQALLQEGKTVKGERVKERAKGILKKTIRKNIVFKLPESCSFAQEPHMVFVEFSCEELSGIKFQYETPDKKTLEALEECQRTCTGDFVFVPMNQFIPDELFWIDQYQGLQVKIRMVKAKPGKKAEE